MNVFRLATIGPCPMKSARNFGRRERSNAPSSPPTFGSTIRLSTHPPCQNAVRSPARSRESLQRPPDQDFRGCVRAGLLAQGCNDHLRLPPVEPKSDERLGGLDLGSGRRRDSVARRDGGIFDRHLLQPIRELQGDPLRQLLPAAGDSRKGGAVL